MFAGECGGYVAITSQKDVTRMLLDWSQGNQEALDRLMPLVYDELRRLARRCLRREPSGHTLQATALVNEAYLKLIQQSDVQWQNRAHFFAIAARLMRRILVDHARRHQASKRGGMVHRLPLDEALDVPEAQEVDLIALEEALIELARLDPEQCRIVELRFFGGLTVEEIAEVLGVSISTVKREWIMAKAWLFREIQKP
jgi:RNA polymerase sigma factor (TIGR02999 family)